MTALVVFQQGNLDASIAIRAEDCDVQPTRAELGIGETYTRRELLACLLLSSANDAALALARDGGGTLPAFVARMNTVAAALGMMDSYFANPHGLPDDRQFSSARDMAGLAKAVDAAPYLRQLVGMRSHRLQKHDREPIELRNTNQLLDAFPACDGMKTGFTRAAGACLIASGEANCRRRIGVILNSTKEDIWVDAQEILGWSLDL